METIALQEIPSYLSNYVDERKEINMDINPELIKAGTYVGKTSAQAIFDKVKFIRESKDKEEAVNKLGEIINELIADKNELIQTIRVYEEQLIAQKISDEDIEFITESIVPLLEELLSKSSDTDAEKAKEAIELFKPLLSKDTFNILQLLGFNFKEAIGQPLTQIVMELITSMSPTSEGRQLEREILAEQRTIEYWKVVQNEEAFQRHLRLAGEG
ncbi:hypothetical protein SAMN05421743_12148 [Thalassobacillus cyri]|uniref:Uncharacterized protein n=1 Tax=Thalassobacillus cyri TaxID=571932 RepID=A0A1H4H1Y3_9BACI|nr:hypothetical protein [Thalassobacillus cyri]SEB15813.1 hypothetical protein SAMN05421743_12148 [Thalassobacillus cyri]